MPEGLARHLVKDYPTRICSFPNTHLYPSGFAFFTQNRETKDLRASAPLESRRSEVAAHVAVRNARVQELVPLGDKPQLLVEPGRVGL